MSSQSEIPENAGEDAKQDDDHFESWAILELMGHRKLAGKVSEATIAGGSFLRIDVPEAIGRAAFTQFYGPSAIYCISPVSEEVARRMAERSYSAPISQYELPSPRQTTLPIDDEEDEPDDDYDG